MSDKLLSSLFSLCLFHKSPLMLPQACTVDGKVLARGPPLSFFFSFYKCVCGENPQTHCAGSATHSPTPKPSPHGRPRPPAAELSSRRSKGTISESEERAHARRPARSGAFRTNGACEVSQSLWRCCVSRCNHSVTYTEACQALNEELWLGVKVVWQSPLSGASEHKTDQGSLHMQTQLSELVRMYVVGYLLEE